MTAELGNFSLALALVVALLQGALPLWAAWRGHAGGMALAQPLAWAQGVCVGLSFAALLWVLASNDFSVAYVAANSNSQLPLVYRLCAAWGGHEGSVLLWAFMLAGWGAAVAALGGGLPAPVRARVLAVMGWVGAGGLAFVLFTSNPFARLLPAATDGRDLNPLLQDLGMIAHPPLLYMGYVGFSVAFAFAMAALLGGQLDAAWARWTRPWTLAAWACLTLGIVLGSAWAYNELGWGGWWFWDAVENASFMPWLLGTALIHSLAVTEKRDAFKNWTVLLAILAFSLSLLGTFLVRSGVLSSVHAFAADPRRGVVILIFLAVVIGSALTLYAWRAPSVGLGQAFGLFSREALLLLNNVLLAAAAGTVLLGTLYPLVVDALGQGKISVGPPYFEAVFVPLMLPLVVLTAIGPLLAWKQARWAGLGRSLAGVALGALVFALVLGVGLRVVGQGAAVSVPVWLGLGAGAWLVLGTLWVALKRGRSAAGWRTAPLAWWGMVAAHTGLGVFVLAVTVVRGFETSSDHSLHLGEQAQLAGYRFVFAELNKVQGPNYVAAQARFDVSLNGQPVAVLLPEKRLYRVQNMPMTEAAVDRGLWRDVYIALHEAAPNGAWVVRVQHKPGMSWLWVGAALMALGGVLAAADRRYRR